MHAGLEAAYAGFMARSAALGIAVAALALLILVGGDDSLARIRYRLVFDQAKRECMGAAILDPLDDSGTTQWSGSVQFDVHPGPVGPGFSAADRKAFAAGCRAGAFKRPS